MLKLTKQMKADLRKLKEADLIVCDACGSEDVAEKIWVDVNSYVQIDGDSYYKYDESTDNCTPRYWCNKCYEEAVPVHISEYKGDEDAKQKS